MGCLRHDCYQNRTAPACSLQHVAEEMCDAVIFLPGVRAGEHHEFCAAIAAGGCSAIEAMICNWRAIWPSCASESGG